MPWKTFDEFGIIAAGYKALSKECMPRGGSIEAERQGRDNIVKLNAARDRLKKLLEEASASEPPLPAPTVVTPTPSVPVDTLIDLILGQGTSRRIPEVIDAIRDLRKGYEDFRRTQKPPRRRR
jgi:hypothetical protein